MDNAVGANPSIAESDFVRAVGIFIHHCGALEFFVNGAIKAYAEDEVLASATMRSPLKWRIALLKRLLLQRSDLKDKDITDLCQRLEQMREWRNDVAHNPILSKEPNPEAEQVIAVPDPQRDGTIQTREISPTMIKEYANASRELALQLLKLVPRANTL